MLGIGQLSKGIIIRDAQYATGYFVNDMENEDELVYDEWSLAHNDSDADTITLNSDNSIRILSTSAADTYFWYHKYLEPIIPGDGGEMLATIKFDVALHAHGVIGFCGYMERITANVVWGTKCVIKYHMNTGKLYVVVTSDDKAQIWHLTVDSGNNDVIHESDNLSGRMDGTKRNVFTFRLMLSKGTNQGVRIGLEMNDRLIAMTPTIVDSDLDFATEIHPYIGVGSTSAGYIDFYGLEMSQG